MSQLNFFAFSDSTHLDFYVQKISRKKIDGIIGNGPFKSEK